MFRNPVVVKGYPIPRRSEPDTGLEIPLNIMAGLIGTRHINIFNEQLFIKSFSMMLVRTKEIEDLLIWHLFYDKNGHYISYSDNTVPYPEKGNEFNLEGKRNIVLPILNFLQKRPHSVSLIKAAFLKTIFYVEANQLLMAIYMVLVTKIYQSIAKPTTMI
ncbi:hypothetical protein DH86_00004357 [Scytalidium sp. 3C]|nr:hypothetical protein DH86_00004357 [Scytalidium sp. 3C]